MWTHSDTGFQSTVPSVGTYPMHLLGWSLQLWRKQNLIMCSVFPLALLELRDISTYSLCLTAATAKWQISESLYIRPVHTGALLDFKKGLLILPWSSHPPSIPATRNRVAEKWNLSLLLPDHTVLPHWCWYSCTPDWQGTAWEAAF